MKRFLDAHKRDYEQALREIRAGHKQSHWIWYIFPQLKELGYSSTAKYYGIRDLEEAKAFLAEPTLRAHLLEICGALLALDTDDPHAVMGYPDELKLRSSVTLFREAEPDCPVFQQILEKYYDGEPDQETLSLLQKFPN
ncbi:MAG: DUF1810 domain-containing protein [Flexilinea sp.]|nr:DUF1810 domain-containing protein [Flexilinea sp.]